MISYVYKVFLEGGIKDKGVAHARRYAKQSTKREDSHPHEEHLLEVKLVKSSLLFLPGIIRVVVVMVVKRS
jgi:hypothetical protein